MKKETKNCEYPKCSNSILGKDTPVFCPDHNRFNGISTKKLIEKVKKEEREYVFEKMKPYTIRAREQERIATFTHKQFKSIL